MTETTVETPAEDHKKILSIAIRAKCGTVDLEVEKLPDASYEYLLALGAETFINKQGMSKIATGITKLSGDAHAKAVAAVMEQAAKNLQALYDGNIKVKGAAKVSGAVNTEAMRLAKAMVKDLLRANGYKVSAFDAKEITTFAKEVLKSNPNLYKTAEANLAAREDAGKSAKGFDISKMLGGKANDESLKAKPKVPPKPKAKGDKPTLSAKQAGLVAPRAKPAQHTAH